MKIMITSKIYVETAKLIPKRMEIEEWKTDWKMFHVLLVEKDTNRACLKEKSFFL